MSVTPRSLALNDQITGTAAASTDELYSASNGVAQIDQATAINSSGSAVNLFVYILPSGTAATAVDPVTTVSVPANDEAILSKLIAHKVPSGGTIEAYAGTTNVIRVTLSGVEFT